MLAGKREAGGAVVTRLRYVVLFIWYRLKKEVKKGRHGVLDGFRKRFCGFVVEKMPTNIFLVVPSRIGRSLESHDRSTYLLATLGS